MAENIEETIRSNGFDPDETRGLVGRIMALFGDIDQIMDAAKEECSPLREDIARVKKEATDAGFNRKAFNHLISDIRSDQKKLKRRMNLDEDQRNLADMMRESLGDYVDTELGLAALKRAEAA